MCPAKDPRPDVRQYPFGKNNFSMSIVLKELAEFDIKTSVGLAIVE